MLWWPINQGQTNCRLHLEINLISPSSHYVRRREFEVMTIIATDRRRLPYTDGGITQTVKPL